MMRRSRSGAGSQSHHPHRWWQRPAIRFYFGPVVIIEVWLVLLLARVGEPVSYIVAVVLVSGIGSLVMFYGFAKPWPGTGIFETFTEPPASAGEVAKLTRFIRVTHARHERYRRQWQGHRVQLRKPLSCSLLEQDIAAGTWGTIRGIQFDANAPFAILFDGEFWATSPDLQDLDLHLEEDEEEPDDDTPG